MKKIKYSKYMRASALILVLMLLMTGCQTTNSSDALQVQTMKVATGSIETSLQLSGVLLPNETVNITSKASGEVKTAAFNIGDAVKAGDVLFELDTKSIDAQLQQAEAGLVSAQSAYDASRKQVESLQINLDNAQKSYNDTKSLYESGAVSKTQFDDAKTKLDLAKKQVENANGPQQNQASAAITTANASINTLQVQKDNAVIKSPINGVVITRGIQLGEIASPGAPLMTIADLSSLKMKGTIPQEDIPFLTVGQSIDMHVDIYPDQAFKGTILTIGPMAVSTGKIFPIEIALKNESNLMAGLSASASLDMVGKPHAVVPKNAVVSSEGGTYVFVITDGKAVKRPVVTGLSNDESIEILSGLELNEEIAISNTHILQDQMNVTVKQ